MKKAILLISLSILIYYPSKSQENRIGSGISMQFNGNSNNYVDLGDVYNSLTFPCTIEAWVKLYSFLPVTSFIFSSDNSSSVYTGLVLHVHFDGKVDFAFGSGGGAGPQNRRDIVSTTSIPLNQWVHIAGVANSAFDMHLYINGVESNVTQDGSGTAIASNSTHAFIGKRIDPYNTLSFNGEIDEVKLWSVGRTQTEIQTYMCRRIDINTPGLLGYWNADESYSSSTIKDFAGSAESGTIVGTVSKITSGAPVGNASKFTYSSAFFNTLSLTDSTGDKLTVSNVGNSPFGVHIYGVNHDPYYSDGLTTTPPYYFGVFCANNGSTATYTATYEYNQGNGVITTGNESVASLFTRSDGSVGQWINSGGILNTGNNTITKDDESSRGEYILNIDEEFNRSTFGNTTSMLQIYPNPAKTNIEVVTSSDDFIQLFQIIDTNGKIVISKSNVGSMQKFNCDISHLSTGIYFLNLVTSNKTLNGKFIVEN